RSANVVVDDGHVELGFSGQFGLRGGQSPLLLLGRFGAAPGQSGDEFVPAGRGAEDEPGVGHLLLDLAGSLQVDLEQRRDPLLESLAHRPGRGAVAVTAVDRGVFELLTVAVERIEVVLALQVIMDTIDLAGPPGSRGGGHGEPDLGVILSDVRADGAFSDSGRSRENGESIVHRSEVVTLRSISPTGRTSGARPAL